MPVEVLLLVAALELVCAVALYVMGRPIKAELELKASIREKKIEMRQASTTVLIRAFPPHQWMAGRWWSGRRSGL